MPPRIAKLLAVVAALAMVGVALFVRSRIADDDERRGAATATARESLHGHVHHRARGDLSEAGARGHRGRRSRTRARPLTRSWPRTARLRRLGDDRSLARDGRHRAAAGPTARTCSVQPTAARVAATWCSCWPARPRPSAGGTASSTPPGSSRRSGSRRTTAASGVQVVGEAFSSHMGTTDFSRAGHPGRVAVARPAPGLRARDRCRTDDGDAGHGRVHRRRHHRAAGGHGARHARRRPAQPPPGHPGGPARADVVVATVAGSDGTDRLRGLFTGQTARTAFEDEGWATPAAEGATGLPAADLLVALREETDR